MPYFSIIKQVGAGVGVWAGASTYNEIAEAQKVASGANMARALDSIETYVFADLEHTYN